MMNRYFDSSADKDFIIANAALNNIYFALVSLNHIFQCEKFYENSISVYHNKHTYYFYHIQALLTACGNLCNVFYNNTHRGNKDYTKRCARLRNKFNISKSEYPLVFKKEARNTNEHFDERYEEFNGSIGDYNLLDEDVDPKKRDIILKNPHLRTYDIVNRIYYTYDNSQNRIIYDFNELKIELDKMLVKILEHPTTESAWIE